MRRIVLGIDESIADLATDGDDVLRGDQAYRFLLEVVCGLHSPVKGETEVQGQFRDFIDRLQSANNVLTGLMQNALCDARSVRHRHLNGLGSQSYGSFARRKLKAVKRVHVIGTGRLAEELFPWIAKLDAAIRVFGRSAEKLENIKSRFPHFELEIVGAKTVISSDSALVLAAPIGSQYLRDWFGNEFDQYAFVLDYRGESSVDALKVSAEVLSLKDIFKELEQSRLKVNDCVHNATLYIQELVEKRRQNDTASYRRPAKSSGETPG